MGAMELEAMACISGTPSHFETAVENGNAYDTPSVTRCGIGDGEGARRDLRVCGRNGDRVRQSCRPTGQSLEGLRASSVGTLAASLLS
jgi:hypothetical protein